MLLSVLPTQLVCGTIFDQAGAVRKNKNLGILVGVDSLYFGNWVTIPFSVGSFSKTHYNSQTKGRCSLQSEGKVLPY
jgi:hypothetical protein